MRRRTLNRSRVSEEKIIGILKEHKAGAKATDLSRKHGISDATFNLDYPSGTDDVLPENIAYLTSMFTLTGAVAK